MSFFHDKSAEALAHNSIGSSQHKAALSHEVIAAAASYELAKAYEHHVEKNGKPVSHAKAKEVLAGLVGAAVDRLVETKGLDFVDKKKLEHDAKKRVEEASESHY